MFRSFCLCSCLLVLVNCAAVKDSGIAQNFGYDQTGDGIARRSRSSVQGQLQVAVVEEKLHALPHSNRTGSSSSSSVAVTQQEVASQEVHQQQQQNGTMVASGAGQKISEANQKGNGDADEEDDELVGDKIGSACLACLAGGGLG